MAFRLRVGLASILIFCADKFDEIFSFSLACHSTAQLIAPHHRLCRKRLRQRSALRLHVCFSPHMSVLACICMEAGAGGGTGELMGRASDGQLMGRASARQGRAGLAGGGGPGLRHPAAAGADQRGRGVRRHAAVREVGRGRHHHRLLHQPQDPGAAPGDSGRSCSPPGAAWGDCGTARGDHSAAREDYCAVCGECGPSYSPPGATRHAKQLQGPGPALQHVKPAATAVYLGSSV